MWKAMMDIMHVYVKACMEGHNRHCIFMGKLSMEGFNGHCLFYVKALYGRP